ncbi:MacS family sensor histidine kinase [Nocardiopsis rhodophaea]
MTIRPPRIPRSLPSLPSPSTFPTSGRTAPAMGYEAPIWRAISAFRIASLVYALALIVQHHALLARPWLAWTVFAAMVAWTAVAGYAYAADHHRHWRLLLVDLTVTFACQAATMFAASPGYLRMAPPLTATWFGGAALAAAVIGGRRWALIIAVGYGIVDITVRVTLGLDITAATPRGMVLLILAGFAVGYMTHIAQAAERRFAAAVELEARTRERERLARSIHDSVLQVLAIVQRRGTELGGEAADLGRLAGEQEAKLRALIGVQAQADRMPVDAGAAASATGVEEGRADLSARLGALACGRITVSAPAAPVLLAQRAVEQISAAVQAALANVERHCPGETRVWLLVEDEGDTVTVTVRDDGPGMEESRIDEAASDGRLGIAQSIKGRVRDLGGETAVFTAPGEGTEIEMRVPR